LPKVWRREREPHAAIAPDGLNKSLGMGES